MRKILFLVFVLSAGIVNAQDVIPEFTGYVGAPTDETDNLYKRFNDFMLNNEGNVIYLNVTLDSDQHEALKDPTEDFYFFAVYDDYPDKLSGNEYHFMKSKTPASWSFNTDENVVEGYFRVENISGPQNGLFAIEMVRVKKVE
ncbi:MAG TPA: hypothetical protein VK004_00490 [Ignavibacteria bacterium]|nr:hypothetical protein [Ignavibacteria bacterium]